MNIYLNTILQHHLLPVETLEQITTTLLTDTPLHQAIQEANQILTNVELKLTSIKQKNQQFYAVVNTSDDVLARSATRYTPLELIYFSAIVKKKKKKILI